MLHDASSLRGSGGSVLLGCRGSGGRHPAVRFLRGIYYLVRIYEGRVLAQCRQLEVEVVAIELGLDGVPSKTQKVLLEFLVFLVLPVLIDVLLVKVVFLRRNEGGHKFAVPQIVPGEVSQPGMRFHFRRTVKPESVRRLPLNHLRDLRQS